MEEVVYGSGVTAIEWAERISEKLPDERIDITLKWLDDTTREIEMKAFGRHHKKVLKEVREDLRKVADCSRRL